MMEGKKFMDVWDELSPDDRKAIAQLAGVDVAILPFKQIGEVYALVLDDTSSRMLDSNHALCERLRLLSPDEFKTHRYDHADRWWWKWVGRPAKAAPNAVTSSGPDDRP